MKNEDIYSKEQEQEEINESHKYEPQTLYFIFKNKIDKIS